MTPSTPPLLPVSILAGPSARALVNDIVSCEAKCRFGLLVSSGFDSQPTHDQLLVEPLVAANDGGYDPGQIRAQISAIAARALVDHLLVECDSKTHPIALASLFLPDGGHGQDLSQVASLSSILLAAESEVVLGTIVQGNHNPAEISPCILADQIECSDVVVLKGELANRDFMLARAVVSALNPRARILQRSRDTKSQKMLNDGMSFDFEAVFAGPGWKKLIEEESGIRPDDNGVTTFVYRARRPFHPGKFWEQIQSPFPGVFRAKGFFWLATRMSIVGGLNIAGSECYCSPAGLWWAANARDNDSDRLEIPDHLKKEWTEPFGDRRQAIAFMGTDVDSTDLIAKLDACLLNDSEMKSGARNWERLPDPFPAWPAKSHDNSCDDHDCCHH